MVIGWIVKLIGVVEDCFVLKIGVDKGVVIEENRIDFCGCVVFDNLEFIVAFGGIWVEVGI